MLELALREPAGHTHGQFTLLDTFAGDALPSPGHQWSSKLTADSDNLILKWFNSHR